MKTTKRVLTSAIVAVILATGSQADNRPYSGWAQDNAQTTFIGGMASKYCYDVVDRTSIRLWDMDKNPPHDVETYWNELEGIYIGVVDILATCPLLAEDGQIFQGILEDLRRARNQTWSTKDQK